MDSKRKVQITNVKQDVNSIFKKIAEIEYNTYSTLVGIVKSFLEPLKTKGTDFITTIVVSDEDQNQIDVKIFTKTPRFANAFKEFDIVRIPSIKLLKPGTGITGLGSQIEVIGNIYEDNPRVFITDSERNKIERLKKAFVGKKTQAIELCKINQMISFSNFSFNGLLLDIKEETPTLTVLTMVDFTKSDLIHPVIQNAAFTNNMTLMLKVWGEKQASEVKNLLIDKIYHVSQLRTEKLDFLLEAKISESFYVPLKELEPTDPQYKEIIENQKLYFNEAKPVKTINDDLPERFKKFELSKIVEIKKNGIFRIRSYAVFNFPFKPVAILICDNCRSLESKDLKFKNIICCKKSEKCNQYKEKIIKVQLKDSSGSLPVILKSKLAEKYSKNIALYKHMELDYIILRKAQFHFLIDANF